MTSIQAKELQASWNALMLESGLSSDAGKAYFEQLCSAYTESHRFYHNLDHIAFMLTLLRDSGHDKPLTQWATWYHDVVYKPGSTKNEKLSAELAESSMRALGIVDN
jgi:predicted metal-dependent HD superfamily phosphohydrolase